MGEAEVVYPSWRLVEVGRVALFSSGPYDGRLAAVAEIVDHKRVLLDGPSTDPAKAVPRHCCPLAKVALTPIVIPKLPNKARSGAIRKAWEAHEVDKKWDDSNWAKTRAKSARRKALTDFERFKVMRLRKQLRFEEKKQLAKVRATAKA